MKKCMSLIGTGVVLTMVVGALCVAKRKEKKGGVRHAAAKLMDGINDFLDDLGTW